jgi:predicted NAD/FAD-dependent oxidoreductase
VAASVVEATKAGGFRVTCEGAAGGSEALDADAVVVATSAAAAAGLVAPIATPPERDYLASVAVGPEVVLALALSRAPTGLPQRIRVPRGEDQPMASLLLEPGLAGGRAPRDCGVALLRATDRFALANQGASGDVVEKGLLAGLARLLPHVASSVEHAVLNRRHAARPEFVVGSYRALDRFRRVQADRRAQGRRLYFAGDHLIGPTAEGSVVSGRRAAADLVADQAAL